MKPTSHNNHREPLARYAHKRRDNTHIDEDTFHSSLRESNKFAKLLVRTSAYASLPYMAVRASTHPCAPVRTYPHPYTPVHTLTDGCGRVRTSCTAVYCCVLLCTAASEAVPAASQSGGAGVNCVRECPGRPPGASPALKCKIQKSLFSTRIEPVSPELELPLFLVFLFRGPGFESCSEFR